VHLLGELFDLLRSGNALNFQAAANSFRQIVQRMSGGRAGSEANYASLWHELNGCARSQLLFLVEEFLGQCVHSVLVECLKQETLAERRKIPGKHSPTQKTLYVTKAEADAVPSLPNEERHFLNGRSTGFS